MLFLITNDCFLMRASPQEKEEQQSFQQTAKKTTNVFTQVTKPFTAHNNDDSEAKEEVV